MQPFPGSKSESATHILRIYTLQLVDTLVAELVDLVLGA